MKESEVRSAIARLVETDLPALAPHLQSWVESHLVTPREATFHRDSEGDTPVRLWLVTDHVGFKDSSYRVVYDPDTEGFGLAVELKNGVDWYMGPYGSFAETIWSM
ncbi:MAG TPA: hypothetical protein VNT75_01335 [Symbiobacteriaceae bacterium]|nr:hypothetical protein [Symbiobacteriaceae bacterium]